MYLPHNLIRSDGEKQILSSLTYTPIPVRTPIPCNVTLTTSSQEMYDIKYNRNINYNITRR